jgi:hypothetical protein
MPFQYAHVLAIEPGNNATVLEAFASTDGTPTAISVGSETKEPPPAKAFMPPATKPLTDSNNRSFMAANV